MPPQNREFGNFPRNQKLRARIVAALRERGRLDATELANLVYGRPRRRRCSPPDKLRVAATQRALRFLIAKNAVVLGGKFGRRNTYQLPGETDRWARLSLGAAFDPPS